MKKEKIDMSIRKRLLAVVLTVDIDEIGADGYSKDAAECVKLVEKLLQK